MSEKQDFGWCIYSHSSIKSPEGVARVISFQEETYVISPGENLRAEFWNPDYIKTFSKFSDAVNYFLENRPKGDLRDSNPSDEKALEILARKFPKQFLPTST